MHFLECCCFLMLLLLCESKCVICSHTHKRVRTQTEADPLTLTKLLQFLTFVRQKINVYYIETVQLTVVFVHDGKFIPERKAQIQRTQETTSKHFFSLLINFSVQFKSFYQGPFIMTIITFQRRPTITPVVSCDSELMLLSK